MNRRNWLKSAFVFLGSLTGIKFVKSIPGWVVIGPYGNKYYYKNGIEHPVLDYKTNPPVFVLQEKDLTTSLADCKWQTAEQAALGLLNSFTKFKYWPYQDATTIHRLMMYPVYYEPLDDFVNWPCCGHDCCPNLRYLWMTNPIW